jgi:hypothetical protein
VSHRASLDVSAPVLKAVNGWIARYRRRPGTRPGQRVGTVHAQVVLALRWLRHRLDVRILAADAGVSIATAYRYLHEALEVIAGHAPALGAVLTQARAVGLPFLCLDGTLIPTGWPPAPSVAITCGIPASTTPSAAACRSSATPVAFRCGSPPSGPARPMI